MPVNGTRGLEPSSPCDVHCGDDHRSTEAGPSTQPAQLPPAPRGLTSCGTVEAVDCDHLRNMVEANSIASRSSSHRLFPALSRRTANGTGLVSRSNAVHAAELHKGVRREELRHLLREEKKVWALPLLVLLVCIALGLWGVFASSAQERSQRHKNALNRATDKAQTIASELRASYLPVKVMQSFVTRSPYFPSLNATFPSLASELLSLTAAGAIANMQLAPLGVVAAIQPPQGSESALGHDILADPANRDMALRAIASHNLTLAGPYMLRQGFMGAPARYPIFLRDVDENETFGLSRDATNCSSLCYDAGTRTKFWGFATVLIDWDRFINQVVRIGELSSQGLKYRLTRGTDGVDTGGSGSSVSTSDVSSGSSGSGMEAVWLAGSKEALHDPVHVYISVPNNEWRLGVEDARGWVPAWKWPLVAMVVVMGCVLAALVGHALLGRAQQRQLLLEVMAANGNLEDAASVLLREKERVEALLQRQYD
ncbi:hypothetical protein Agub_g8921, partial [Astrephomene gubernaculifera]